MYNANRKEQYIEEKGTQNLELGVVGVRLFNRIAETEERLQLDCCEFSILEIMTFYKSLCYTSQNTLFVTNSLLKSYTSWCLSKGYVSDHQNHYNELSVDNIYSCVNHGITSNKIFSKDDIDSIINNCETDSDAVLVLALYEGICGTNMCELVGLNVNDIDGNVIHLVSGRDMEIPARLVLLIESANEEEGIIRNGVLKKYIESDKVFKVVIGSRHLEAHRKTLYTKLARIKEHQELLYLTTFNIMESGRIEMIKKMKSESGMSVEDILYGRYTEDKYGKILNVRDYIRKYQKWLE